MTTTSSLSDHHHFILILIIHIHIVILILILIRLPRPIPPHHLRHHLHSTDTYTDIGHHQCFQYLWTSAYDGASPVWRVLNSAVEQVVEAELPCMAALMRRAAVPAALPAARWLSSCWVNFLPWRAALDAVALPLLLGADFQVYLCVAALRGLTRAAVACAHSADLAILLHQPLLRFRPRAELPYLLALRDQYRSLFERIHRAEHTSPEAAGGSGGRPS
ncbi:hypothetical protein AB1Y20_017175 [Prymnesium parvum]|uniref:BROMI C-terminal Rab TBC-like domain-containing protein n=1 Tax=Prymnesium parvum TaxID=97485 RepID=A0AB34ID55_PRYPA